MSDKNELRDYCTGDIDNFSKEVKIAFDVSNIPIEIFTQGKKATSLFLGAFFSSTLRKAMEKAAIRIWEECNIEIIKNTLQ